MYWLCLRLVCLEIAAPFSWGISALEPLVVPPLPPMDFMAVAGIYGQGTMSLYRRSADR